MYPWLEDAITRDAVVITASRRLARELRAAYAERQLEAGARSWLTPSILFWNDWCRRQLEAATDPDPLPLTIDNFSSAILWERCLRKHLPDGLPALSGVIRQARDAWQRVNNWDVPLAALKRSARSPDEQLFAAAAADYQALLEAACWTDQDGIPRLVSGLITKQRVNAPKEAVFAGFDRFSPAVSNVIDALQLAGCAVQTAPEPVTSAAAVVAPFEDHDAELRAAGAWARDQLNSDATSKIAIISHALQNDADRDARLVREGLAPGWQYAGERLRTAVNVSYGRKLSDFPAISTALLILRWIHNGLSTREISLLLRSKCLASQKAAGRSRMELALRKLPDRAWTAGSLLRVLKGRDESEDALAWFRGMEAILTLQQDAQREASPAYWASRMDSLLNDWRWPGAATLTSSEFQLINRWRDLLNELARTAIVTPQLRFNEAVQRLASLATDVVFQPQTDAGVVSLMGTLEAAGLEFDHVWISGMHAGLWPPAGNPSPLLSRELQQEFDLPDATPADTLLFSRRVLQRLTCCSRTAVLSWPRSDGESELAVSSLLDDMALDRYRGPADPGWHAAHFCGKDATSVITEDPVPLVTSDEVVTGGAYTVQRQTTEPFSAFVYGRLGVRRPDAIETGIAPSVRGNIIHNALHTLFAGRPTLADIRSWESTNLAERLGSAIDAALATHLRHADATHTRLLGLERTRLFQLLRNFVAAELERPEFSVVAVEESIDFEAFGVRLSLRVDRIDRLADGSLLIIDYKTGMPRNLLNKDGDPVDLQLVVYADAVEEAVGGLALINIDSRSIIYKGTGGSVEWDVARQDQWPERLQAWRDEVHQALAEFAAGDVRINLHLTADEGRPLGILSRLEEYKRAY
jgi:probable DNA repair protein